MRPLRAIPWVSSALLFAAATGAQLPTGVTLEPFYDTAYASFVRDSARTVGLAEVPGAPEHFLVLDPMGLVYSLYPDSSRARVQGRPRPYAKATLADFRSRVKKNLRSEMGAWALAFSPAFERDRRFYTLYFGYNTQPTDAIRTDGWVTLDRWTLSADLRRAVRDTTVFRFYHEPSYGVSTMAFGPDGMLYLATSVYSEDGWDTTSLARKILRIDVGKPSGNLLYSIPADNPFAKSPDAAVKKEIWAWGLRNVWSLSFDFLTGKLWAGDVGQTLFEEINLVEKGKNYGWADGGNSEPSANGYGVQGKCPSGFSARGLGCAGLADPAWEFAHTGGQAMSCIVVGPAFRGDPASPFHGWHFVTDVQRNQFYAVKEGQAPQLVGKAPASLGVGTDGHNGIVHLSEDSRGNLYATLVSWYFNGSIGGSVNALPAGQRMHHEIYRLSHPQLTPRAVPSAFRGPGLPEAAARRAAMALPGSWVTVPQGFAGFTVHDARGRQAWKWAGAGGARVPEGLGSGVMSVRFLSREMK